ncbi:Putative restriction endonuclease [Sinosporangium album]|uniref:Putative restriction endonuclease n=1 Tax=Sinosporangium album TaxID=504805 RepID=A0A1G7S128_9ACTN|nr:Uma2 family endonuclease [Sinosporangium album]SDG16732.1 Putative restriction endonuclease [Sinosporangium album]
MPSPSRPPATPWRTPGVLSVDEWLALNDQAPDGSRYELIDGSLILSPPAGFVHQWIGAGLHATLRAAAPADLVVVSSVGLMLDDSPGALPDLLVLDRDAFARAHRAARGGRGADTAQVARPEWVKLAVEVVSPPHQVVDRLLKPTKYAEAGIPAFWRVETHPFRGQGGDELPVVFAYTLDGEVYRLTHRAAAGSPTEVALPFPFTLDPGSLSAT